MLTSYPRLTPSYHAFLHLQPQCGLSFAESPLALAAWCLATASYQSIWALKKAVYIGPCNILSLSTRRPKRRLQSFSLFGRRRAAFSLAFAKHATYSTGLKETAFWRASASSTSSAPDLHPAIPQMGISLSVASLILRFTSVAEHSLWAM